MLNYVYMSVWACAQVCRKLEGDTPETEVSSICELPILGLGTECRSSTRAAHTLNHS